MWLAARASSIPLDGKALSSATGSPCNHPPAAPWVKATVPGTVLNTLVKAGTYQDPYVGVNSKDIDDIGVVGADFYTYWFCTDFMADGMTDGLRWLVLEGVNYSLKVNHDAFLMLMMIPTLRRPCRLFFNVHMWTMPTS